MKLLIAEIKRQLTRRVCNAVDRSEAMKWRRIVAGRAPFAARDPRTYESQLRELTEMTALSSDETADG